MQISRVNNTNFTGAVDLQRLTRVVEENPKISDKTEWLVKRLQQRISGLRGDNKLRMQEELNNVVNQWFDANERINLFNNFMDNNDAYLLSSVMKYSGLNSRIETRSACEIAKDSCNTAFRDRFLAEKALNELNVKVSKL